MTYEINIERSSVENYSICDATNGSASECLQCVKIIVVATISSKKKVWILIVILILIPLIEGSSCGM
jgi:hypothetical protein